MPRGDQVREQRTLGKETDHALACVRVTLAQPSPTGNNWLSPGPSYATWVRPAWRKDQCQEEGKDPSRRWLWAQLQPHKLFCRPRGQVSQRQPHTMGAQGASRLGPRLLLAVASGAKVARDQLRGQPWEGAPSSP